MSIFSQVRDYPSLHLDAVRLHVITVAARMYPIVIPDVLDSIPSQRLGAHMDLTLVFEVSRSYVFAYNR